MHASTPYKRAKIAERYDAIVIGSGIGGLTTAAMLAKHKNKRVLVLERHYTAGGFTHTFRRPGFEWDVGVHYIGDAQREDSTMRLMFDHLTDGELQWADMGEIYDTIHVAGNRYEFLAGEKQFVERMTEYFPAESKAIRSYVDLIKLCVQRSRLYFAEKAVPAPISKLLGGLMRAPLMKYSRRTTKDVLRELTSNEQLIGVLTGQWGNYGLTPSESSFFMHSIVAVHYLSGAAYPVGGAGRILDCIVPLIKAAGGDVLVRAEVEEILVRNNKAIGVRIHDGREILADTIISDAGVANTFERLLSPAQALQQKYVSRLKEIGPSVAHLSLYVGTNKSAEELGLQKSNQWIYQDYDHDKNVARYLADPSGPFPVVYLSFPSAKDPEFENRYPGIGTVEAITMIPFEPFARWANTYWHKRGDDYEALKQNLSDRLQADLLRACPTLKNAISHAELSTPLTTRDFANHPHGEIYGLAHTPERFEQRWLAPRTSIKNLFLTGSDICTAGVGGAMVGGLLCASVISGRNMLSVASRGTNAEPKFPSFFAPSIRDKAAA